MVRPRGPAPEWAETRGCGKRGRCVAPVRGRSALCPGGCGAELLPRGPRAKERTQPVHEHRCNGRRKADAGRRAEAGLPAHMGHGLDSRLCHPWRCRQRGAGPGSLTCPGPSRWELALEGRGGIALAPRSAGRARRPAQAARRPPAHCSLSPEGLRPWLLVAYSIGTASPASFLRGTSGPRRARRGNLSGETSPAVGGGHGAKGQRRPESRTAPPASPWAHSRAVPPLGRAAGPVANSQELLGPRRFWVKRNLAVFRCRGRRRQPGTG